MALINQQLTFPCSHILAAAGPWPSWKVPRNSERDPGWTSSAPVPMTGTKLVSMAGHWLTKWRIHHPTQGIPMEMNIHNSCSSFNNHELIHKCISAPSGFLWSRTVLLLSIFQNHDNYFYDPFFTEAILLPAKAFWLPDPRAVLLSAHSTAVDERTDGHTDHDADSTKNSTEHGCADSTGETIHCRILSPWFCLCFWRNEFNSWPKKHKMGKHEMSFPSMLARLINLST